MAILKRIIFVVGLVLSVQGWAHDSYESDSDSFSVYAHFHPLIDPESLKKIIQEINAEAAHHGLKVGAANSDVRRSVPDLDIFDEHTAVRFQLPEKKFLDLSPHHKIVADGILSLMADYTVFLVKQQLDVQSDEYSNYDLARLHEANPLLSDSIGNKVITLELRFKF